jgi:hypothetical protein
MEASRDPHTRAVERSAWWMRSEMGLRAASDPPVAGPLPARCDLHGLGHARSATLARSAGFLLATASAVALLIGARPAAAETTHQGPPTAQVVGAGLGALGVAGFVAGRAIERRTRYHVWLQCETRTITAADVQKLADTVQDVRARDDRTWTPDHAWLVAPAFAPDAASLARASGVRCFVRQGGQTREV